MEIEMKLKNVSACFCAESRNFLAKWNFKLHNENGIEVKKTLLECTGPEIRPGFGNPKFISHQELSKHVKDGSSVTIFCELSIYGPKQQKDGKKSVNKALPIQRDFKRLFDEEILCDLDIKTNDGVTLRAHKAILAIRSSVLLKMLTADMTKAKKSTVEIEDFDSKTIREMLRFIYCEEVEDFKSNAKQLIYAADKYEIPELKEKCIEEIASKVTNQDVIEALIIADHISGTEELFKVCAPIFNKFLPEMMKNPEWKALSGDMLEKVMTENWKASNTYDV